MSNINTNLSYYKFKFRSYARYLRKRNPKKLMGDAFIDVICLDTGADKDEIPLEYGKDYVHIG